MYEYRAFGERLRAERITRKLNQREAAERFGVSQPSYHRWEAGHTAPAVRFRRKLAEFMGLTQDEIMNLIDHQDGTQTLELVTNRISTLERMVDDLAEEMKTLRRRA